MSKLHKISSERSSRALGAIIFVHGLGGDAYGTWRRRGDADSFWPQWIADDFKSIDVYSLEYEASPLVWLGTTMPIFHRAKQVLTWLEPLSSSPIVFICHSLGGLLVKQMIRTASTGGFDNWLSIANHTRGVVFLGTPHTGADLAGTLSRLGTILGTSVSITELAKNNSNLLEINEWYRNNSTRQLNIKTLPFYETQLTHGILVVDQATSDPTIQGVGAIPLDAAHMTMCKPESRDDFLYVTVRRFIQSCFSKELNREAPSIVEFQGGAVFKSESSESSRRDEAEQWLLTIKNYPAVRPYEIPYEVIRSYAQAFPSLTAAKAFINGVSALRIKLNPERNTERQILVEEQELSMSGNPIDFWTEVLTLAGSKSRRTLAAFIVAANAPVPDRFGPKAVREFNELEKLLANSEA